MLLLPGSADRIMNIGAMTLESQWRARESARLPSPLPARLPVQPRAAAKPTMRLASSSHNVSRTQERLDSSVSRFSPFSSG